MHDANIRVAIAGAGGRMGRQLIQAALALEGVQLGAALEREGSSLLGSDAGELAGAGKTGVTVQTSLDAAQTLIRGAVRHLNSGGELRIVANAFLPYPDVLDETFGFHEVIAQTGRFKVYRAIMTRQAKKG